MKNLRNLNQYIKALKNEIDYLTEQMETATDNVVMNKIDYKIYKMYNLIVALEKMQICLNDIEDLEKEISLL
jgi:3-dehydroquinate synthase class II